MRKIASLALIAILTIGLTACSDLVNPPKSYGTLTISLYGQRVKELINSGKTLPAIVEEFGYPLQSLVRIEGLTPEYYMTDSYGALTIQDVPTGNYSIHPVFMSTTLDVSCTILRDSTTSVEIILPIMQIETHLFHSSVVTKELRKALALSIERQAIIDALSNTPGIIRVPTYNCLPMEFNGDGSLAALHSIDINTIIADILSEQENPINLTITYNINTNYRTANTLLKTRWESFAKIGSITLVEQPWETFLTNQENGNFEICRFGWGFTTNNPMEYYKRILRYTATQSTESQTLLDRMTTALTLKDVPELISLTTDLNNFILDQGLAIPMWVVQSSD